MDVFGPIISHPLFVLAKQLCALFYVVFTLALVFWTWRDADRRGGMAWFWSLAVLTFNVPGWLVYTLVRPPEYADDVRERQLEIRSKELSLQRDSDICPSCQRPVDKDFLICPYCMKKLRKSCVECGKALRMNWGVCPYCRTKQA